jgi:hypothetical protein
LSFERLSVGFKNAVCAAQVVLGTGTIWLGCHRSRQDREDCTLPMFPLTVPGQPLEISLERLGQPMSLYVPLSKRTLYCIEHAAEGLNAVAEAFRTARAGSKHGANITTALAILKACFAGDDWVKGYRKDGPVSVAKFDHGDGTETRELRVLRQRQANDIIEQLLYRIG